jgi:UDP-2-acetamido-2,6-beta-L-arabino-hexul-4-ose reductase
MTNTRNKIKIGITGQQGFIGTHLYNTLGLSTDQFERIEFQKTFFNSPTLLDNFTSQCDVIVHLAGMNRHNDPEVIYQTNLELVSNIISSCKRSNSKAHILFSSSTQEEKDNLYGRSKKEGRLLFENWAKENNSKFSGLIIPNVFGAFGNPYYNSVVATFCHQLTHNETPQIEIDGDLKLIYIENLIKVIINEILNPADQINNISIPHNYEIKVSTLLNKLKNYKMQYFERGEFPEINNELDRDLFITFLTYIDHKSFFPFKLKMNTDNRGSFVETVKLNSGGQISFSTTVPGITRGNHYHTRKAERFAVIKGKALIELRKINTTEVLSFELNGNEPSFVDMPIWYTHNIKNIGSEDLYTIFWINEFFNPNDPDTYFETV